MINWQKTLKNTARTVHQEVQKVLAFMYFRKHSINRNMSACSDSSENLAVSKPQTDSEKNEDLLLPAGDETVIDLPIKEAAPVYATPRGTGKKIYKVEIGRGGQQLANYVLFEDSMEKSKVPWLAYSNMTSEERTIYMAHLKAVRERKLSYKDPVTGYIVMTVSQLLLNGKCCGNGCRHCPYQLENATPEMKKSKIWNGAYYV